MIRIKPFHKYYEVNTFLESITNDQLIDIKYCVDVDQKYGDMQEKIYHIVESYLVIYRYDNTK